MEAQSLPRTGRHFLPRSPRVLRAFPDEKLVEQVRYGNEAAFEVVYDRHHRAILSFCRHMLASVEEAEDAVQHTFIQAYNSLRGDRRDIKLKPWLYAIARNRCLSLLRARREQTAELDDVPTAGLSESVQQRADLRELLTDLRDLPVNQRAALVLSELGDLSHAEIGSIVGCEAPKVKSLVFQARSSLIESRNAREIPCAEIREQLATLSGGALRRGPLRKHLKACPGCAEFRDQVRSQRRAIAAILPVVPSLGLKNSALAAIGIGGGGGGAAAAAGGGIASLATAGGGKMVALIAVAGVAAGGGTVLLERGDKDADAAASQPALVAPPGDIGATGPGPNEASAGSGPGNATTPISRRGNAPGRDSGKPGAGNRRGEPGRGQGGRGNGTVPGSRGNGRGPVPGNGGGRGHGNGNGGGRSANPPAATPAVPATPGTPAQPATPPSNGNRGSNGNHGTGNNGSRGAPAVPPGHAETRPGNGYGHGEEDERHGGRHEQRGGDGEGTGRVSPPSLPPVPEP
jgi:RNA polymerase sigma factor (sigma-70 family)